MNLLQTVMDFAARHECTAGISGVEPLDLPARFVPFVSSDHRKRTDPGVILPGVKCIIVLGMGFGEADNKANGPMPEDAGFLSVLGFNEDYHKRLRKVLKELANELKTLVDTKFDHRILVDSPYLDERALAQRAGLGFYGRSGLIVSPVFGTRFNIGCMLTDLPWDGDDETASIGRTACPIKCGKCIETCPSQALSADGEFNVERCISFLTQKKELTEEEMGLIGRHMYGCDICQAACPFNKGWEYGWARPSQWIDMDDSAFETAYGHTAMLWQGAEILRRNARVVMQNLEQQ